MMYINVKLNEKGDKINGESVVKSIDFSKSIVEEEMDCANIYYYDIKVSHEKIIKTLQESNSTVFTIGLN